MGEFEHHEEHAELLRCIAHLTRRLTDTDTLVAVLAERIDGLEKLLVDVRRAG